MTSGEAIETGIISGMLQWYIRCAGPIVRRSIEFLGRQASAEPIRTKIFRSETRQMRKAAGSLYKETGLPAQPMLARPITE